MTHNVLIGGEAGQGMDTLSTLLETILKRHGYHIYTNKDYMSRIRGGHNFIQVRFGTEPLHSHDPRLDVILALDEYTIESHRERLGEHGRILCDDAFAPEEDMVLALPMVSYAKELGNPKVFGSVAVGALLSLMGLGRDVARTVLQESFKEEIADLNLKALEKGYGLADQVFQPGTPPDEETILIHANNAIGLGALAGGVAFYSAYPMTPSTSIMGYLAGKQKAAGIIVEQAEDEISAINMALGASYGGLRAMTGTSGGGFSLMVEALGLAGITETPLVIANIMRPGPATGFPTRTEQGDLSFVLSAAQGEFPRMVLAVRHPQDAFDQTVRALNLADKYQMLVIMLGDQYIADVTRTVAPFDFDGLTVDRYLGDPDDYGDGQYKRYDLSQGPVSPRLYPGQVPGEVVLADSDEHTEEGHITEAAGVRVSMVDKRMEKLELLREEMIEPQYTGPEKPDVVLIGWGSTHGPLQEALQILADDPDVSQNVGALVFGDLYPLPTGRLTELAQDQPVFVNVEQNCTGQFARLIRQETGIVCGNSILKYDGRQMSAREIAQRVRKEVLGQ